MSGMVLETIERSYPIDGCFTISRGTRTEAVVLEVRASMGGHVGKGECTPYPRYGETVEGVRADIKRAAKELGGRADNASLQEILPGGAARNALDNALLDLRAKLSGQQVHELLGLPAPTPVNTAYTLSLDTVEAVEAKARDNAWRPVLKVKLGGDGLDLERLGAIHRVAPDAKLIIDANEAWSVADYESMTPLLPDLGVALVEQPFHADNDEALRDLPHPVPLAADESCHGRESLPRLEGLYEYINIKLDKTGGLSEGAALMKAARARGLGIMVGCMLGSSLAMAPALYLAGSARFVDLDGPLILKQDHEPGLRYDGSLVHPPRAALWGGIE